MAEYSLDVQSVRFRVTRPQLTLLGHVVDALLVEEQPKPARLTDTSLLEDALARRLPAVVVAVTGAKLQFSQTSDINTCMVRNQSYKLGEPLWLSGSNEKINYKLKIPDILSSPDNHLHTYKNK
jgi:hypothetical protein